MRFKALAVLDRNDIPGSTDAEKLLNCPIVLGIFMRQYRDDLLVPPAYDPFYDVDGAYGKLRGGRCVKGSASVTSSAVEMINKALPVTRHLVLPYPSADDCLRRLYQAERADAAYKKTPNSIKKKFDSAKYFDDAPELEPSGIVGVYPYSLANSNGVMKSYTLSDLIPTVDGLRQFARLDAISMDAELPAIALFAGDFFEAEEDSFEIWSWLTVEKQAGISDFAAVVECEC